MTSLEAHSPVAASPDPEDDRGGKSSSTWWTVVIAVAVYVPTERLAWGVSVVAISTDLLLTVILCLPTPGRR